MSEINSQAAPRSRRWIRRLATLILLFGFVFAIFIGTRPSRYESALSLRQASTLRNSTSTAVDLLAVRRFDEAVKLVAESQSLQLAETSDWLTQCRRISLALMGSGMSFDDIRALEALPERERVSAFLESCLADPRWANYWSERFTRAFVGDNNGPFLLYRRRKFRLWLAEQFANDRSYDSLVRQLITANGLWTDRPEVNFYTATADGDEEGRADPIRIAGRTSRVFLGKRIDCLQCHDDFLGNVNLAEGEETRPGTQADFHRLAAFFDGVSVKNPLSGMVDDGREYKTTLLGQTDPEVIKPKTPFAHELFNDHLPRRAAFADWLTHPENQHFARATVNRVWNLMTGKPLVGPVDDINESDPMMESLEILSSDFVKSDFSIKQLIRTIATTDAFRRESRSDVFEVTSDHERCFAVFPVSRLRPEQIALSLFQAATLQRLNDESNILEQLGRNDQLNKFVQDFGDLGEKELGTIPPTVTQRLLLMNGGVVENATKADLVANAASRIGQFSKDEKDVIRQVYLTFLNRYPTEVELEQLLANYFADEARKQEPFDASRNIKMEVACDLGYALMNSAELQWNH